MGILSRINSLLHFWGLYLLLFPASSTLGGAERTGKNGRKPRHTGSPRFSRLVNPWWTAGRTPRLVSLAQWWDEETGRLQGLSSQISAPEQLNRLCAAEVEVSGCAHSIQGQEVKFIPDC